MACTSAGSSTTVCGPPPSIRLRRKYVAPMYVFLAGEATAGITGQIFSVAGGFIGRFEEAQPTLIAYRDHHDSAPYTFDELTELLT